MRGVFQNWGSRRRVWSVSMWCVWSPKSQRLWWRWQSRKCEVWAFDDVNHGDVKSEPLMTTAMSTLLTAILVNIFDDHVNAFEKNAIYQFQAKLKKFVEEIAWCKMNFKLQRYFTYILTPNRFHFYFDYIMTQPTKMVKFHKKLKIITYSYCYI